MKLRLLFSLLVVVGAARAAEFQIGGGVAKPGAHRLDRDEGVIALIVRAEGFGVGGCTKVRVARDHGKKIIEVNVWELMAEFQPDWLLQAGDVVLVPEHVIGCIQNEKALRALMEDYLKARAQSPTAPADWKERINTRIGGDGQRDYEGARRGVRDLPGKAGAR